MRAHFAGLIALVFASTPVFAAEAGESRPACDAYVAAADPYNASGDAALRRSALAEMERDPAKLTPIQWYGLGALYRLGREHPAALVDQDLVKARRYLEEASLRGQIAAYASMAELELAAGKPLEAMAWTQVYVSAMRLSARGRGLGYPADLVKRVGAAQRPGSRKAQEQYLQVFMQSHGAKFHARQAEMPDEDVVPDCRAANEDWPITRVSDGLSNQGGVGRGQRLKFESARTGSALFLIVVAPDGSVADAHAIESVPAARAAEDLVALVREMRFNAVDASAPPRLAFAPLSYSDGTARLRD